MVQLPLTQTTPLVQESDGTVRVSGTRVTLDTLVGAFQKGATAEQIQDSFPILSLREIYGTIAYYLQHEREVDAYMTSRRDDARALKHEIDLRQDTSTLRARIRAARPDQPAHL